MKISVQIVEGPCDQELPYPDCPGAGAVLQFEGVVRPREDGRPVAALDYEVYEPMATRQLRSLAEEIAASFGLLGVAVAHSRGRVPVSACSFRLRLAAPHRKEALAAMDQFIDRLKQDVPIWKRAVDAP